MYLDGVENSSVGLPQGATIDDSGRIHLASVASSATHQVTALFTAIFAASGASTLTVFGVLRKRRWFGPCGCRSG